MKFLPKKLHSSSGATMLMALVLLLVATMVSAGGISAGMTAANTIRTNQSQQQELLTVTSAAELMLDSFTGARYTIEKNYHQVATSTSWILDKQTVTVPNVSFGETLRDALDTMEKDDSMIGSVKNKYRISGGSFQDVDVTLLVEKNVQSENYDLTALFTSGETSLVLIMEGQRTENTNTIGVKKTNTVIVQWVPSKVKRPTSEELMKFA